MNICDTNSDSLKQPIVSNHGEDKSVAECLNLHQSVTAKKIEFDFELDRSGALRVYFFVIEGLAGTVMSCPRNYQPQTLEMLFELMRCAAKVPGKFGRTGYWISK